MIPRRPGWASTQVADLRTGPLLLVRQPGGHERPPDHLSELFVLHVLGWVQAHVHPTAFGEPLQQVVARTRPELVSQCVREPARVVTLHAGNIPIAEPVIVNVVTKRAAHKIFLGMAPGVGKTYQMLEEAHEEKNRGRDVVIGFLESHGRAETLSQAKGLETLPRRRLEHRGVMLEEMDLPAILRRRPELCLIDELAHTNAPGSENHKRHEDVEQVLAAGIDVYSTVNVQHVESLAGQIGAYTGVPVRETLPDRVLHAADDVVLVDVTPELLIERLKAGKVYVDRSADVAERGFFRPDTLATLREISLLEVAQEAEPGRTDGPRSAAAAEPARRPVLLATHQPAQAPGRVLVLTTPDPWMRPTVYHAFRTAERLHAPFDVLWVQSEGSADAIREHVPAQRSEEVAALRRLVTTLGGTLLVRQGEDLVGATAQVAQERGVTYLVIGRPRRRTHLGKLAHRRLPLELMDALPEVDLQIVALPDPVAARHDPA